MISCAPLLESQTVVTELKWMNTVFFLLLLFVYTAICNYMVEQIWFKHVLFFLKPPDDQFGHLVLRPLNVPNEITKN